jgi:Protein of unknown function (DUF3039)
MSRSRNATTSAVAARIARNGNLCGHKFQPVRDPQRFPVCPKCKELAGMLWGSDWPLQRPPGEVTTREVA